MPQQEHDHGHHGEDRTERLLKGILDVLVESERQNQKRHLELLQVVSGRISDADRKLLDALLKRSETIAKKLEALDAQT